MPLEQENNSLACQERADHKKKGLINLLTLKFKIIFVKKHQQESEKANYRVGCGISQIYNQQRA
jgi:hypothetical protein